MIHGIMMVCGETDNKCGNTLPTVTSRAQMGKWAQRFQKMSIGDRTMSNIEVVTSCDKHPFEEVVPGYRDHRIKSLPAPLSVRALLRFIFHCLHFDKIR